MAWTAKLLCLTFPLASAGALGQVPPSYGLDFVTIGAPGNRPTIPSEVFADPSLQIGAVGYEYRMMRSKLSTAEYVEFVQAYSPFWSGAPTAYTLTGPYIVASQQPNGTWSYSPRQTCANYAASLEWQMAARYCNWLHNGKVNEAWAFESGAYDTSTFNFGPNWSAQLEASPGAKFWIPSLDEATKAAYYDPNRYGLGQEGYWRYPNGSDTPLSMELPENEGETIGDLLWQWGPGPIGWDLGQYPDTRSPWGLIDVSATVPDYTSTVWNWNTGSVYTLGSMASTPWYATDDRLDLWYPGALWGSSLASVRIASAVPSPTTACLFVIAAAAHSFRRNRL